MKFKGNLEALVLGALRDGPLHGYAIAKRIENTGALKMGENQLYPTLHKLERDGFVTAGWQPQDNKPPRKIYSLTQSGSGELEKLRKQWERYSAGMSAILGAAPAKEAHGG